MELYYVQKYSINDPNDVPEPLKTHTHCVDSNISHDSITGRCVIGVLRIINKTSANWYYKKQATSETIIYGSECVAIRTYTELIIG